jgi:hypothetical protein
VVFKLRVEIVVVRWSLRNHPRAKMPSRKDFSCVVLVFRDMFDLEIEAPDVYELPCHHCIPKIVGMLIYIDFVNDEAPDLLVIRIRNLELSMSVEKEMLNNKA